MSIQKRGQPPYLNKGNECSIEGCKNKSLCKTYCAKHYSRFFKTGDPLTTPTGKERGKRSVCCIPDCGGIVEGWHYCHKHYRKWRKYGDPLKVNHPNQGKHRYTKEGYVLIYLPSWPTAKKDGYVLEHRMVIEKKIGRSLTKNEIIHHKDGVRSNNKEDNLELLIVTTHYKGHEPLLCVHCGNLCGH